MAGKNGNMAGKNGNTTTIRAYETEINALWHDRNNGGEGFSPEDEGGASEDAVNDLGDSTGWELVCRSESSDRLAIYRDGDRVIAVGDSHGAWCVDVTEGLAALVWAEEPTIDAAERAAEKEGYQAGREAVRSMTADGIEMAYASSWDIEAAGLDADAAGVPSLLRDSYLWGWRAGASHAAEHDSSGLRLRAVELDGAHLVEDVYGGVWHPGEEAAAEIAAASDPEARAVEIAAKAPTRGVWTS